MKVSFIATVFNEEKSILPLLRSVFSQTRLPDEIIIVDGGSTDKTISYISDFKSNKAKIKLVSKKGNRSVGRNEAIKRAANEIIVCSDAGCILDKNWVKNITKPFEDQDIGVVSGYYRGMSRDIFQKCLIPYVLVMPDKVNENNFLPASRSMAFRKSVWEKVGKFNEKLSHNEDYAFAIKLKEKGIKIVFEKLAIVSWIPRKNLKEAFIMFFRFAKGDVEAGVIRSNVIVLFARYFILLYLLFLIFRYKSLIIILSLAIGISCYIIWAILKNYKYVIALKAIFVLPLIQTTADIAVMLGSITGIFEQL